MITTIAAVIITTIIVINAVINMYFILSSSFYIDPYTIRLFIVNSIGSISREITVVDSTAGICIRVCVRLGEKGKSRILLRPASRTGLPFVFRSSRSRCRCIRLTGMGIGCQAITSGGSSSSGESET